jgi:hypothetical protein
MIIIIHPFLPSIFRPSSPEIAGKGRFAGASSVPDSLYKINYLRGFLELSEKAGKCLSQIAKAKAEGLSPFTRSIHIA